MRRYLESLTARAYAEIHETRDRGQRFRFLKWFGRDFPVAFRRHIRAFALSVAITLAGAVFGAFAVAFDPEAKDAILPEMFANHLSDPAKRVADEEKGAKGTR